MNEQQRPISDRTPGRKNAAVKGAAAFFLALAVCIAALTVAVGGWDHLKYLTKFVQVLSVVDHTYIGDVDMDDVVDAGISAMIDALDDRWSYYMNPEEYAAYQERTSNTYTGIGVTLRTEEDGSLRIVEVAPGSPAMEAGLAAGMTLTALNGETLPGMTAAELGTAIRALDGSFVLTAADEDGQTRDYVLTVGEIYSNPVEYALLDSGVGYIQIKNFDENSAQEAEKALDELLEQNAAALIFDVRDNGGGYVSELTELLDRLLPEGDIFVSVDGRGKEKVTSSDASCLELPMAVLVNGNSYSAAEYFAAALGEYDAAVVVGQPTTGKGRSQITVALADGSAVHISSKRYLTPQRVDLSEQGGIVPDIVVEPGENDPQLAAAEEFLIDTGGNTHYNITESSMNEIPEKSNIGP